MTTPKPLRHLAGVVTTPRRDWLTMAQLAEHGRFPSGHAARLWLLRHPDMPRGRVGRRLVVDRAVFDRYVTEAGRKVG